MSRLARFTPKKTASGSWCINVPAKYSESGKRERHFYRTQALAKDAAAKLKDKREEFGAQARAIAPSLAEQAKAAVKLLEPFGIGLLEAVQRFAEQERRNRSSVTVEEATAAFQSSGKSWGDSQTTAYRLRGEKLNDAFSGRLLSSVTGGELLEHLEETTGGPGAFNQGVRLVRAIWNWCAKPPRSWCNVETVKYLESKETLTDEIGVLTAKEAEMLLRTAEKHLPETVAAFAIALFTGMRQAELARLKPEDITADGIRVPAVSAKTKRRRFINMTPQLAAWLEAYPVSEFVTPPNWKRKEKAVRRLAGWKVWSDYVSQMDLPNPKMPEPPDSAPVWPHNALRHTHATVAIATGVSTDTLRFEFGHAGGSDTLRSHYVGAMPKSEALAILRIGPRGRKLSTINAA